MVGPYCMKVRKQDMWVDYIKELGYNPNCKFSIRPPNSCILRDIDNDDILLAMCNCLQNGAILEVYVHMPEEEYGATFNKVGITENRVSENIEYNEVGEDAFNGVDVSLNTTSNIPSTSNPTAPNIDPSDSEDSKYSVKGSDESTEESDDSEDSELLEDDQYGSDVHEELIQLRAEKRSFMRRRKRRKRIPADTEEVSCGNTRADLGFDETTINTNTLEGRLGGDEPYYASSDACSFETDTDDSCLEKGEKMRLKLPNTKRKKYTTDSVRFDPNSKKIMWQLGMVFESVKEFRLAVTKYVIQRRVQIEKYVNEPTRVRVICCKKCNSKFIASVFKDKVIEQPNIRVFKLQELMRKKYNVHVGKTIARRARVKILNEIMGDHVKEFGRILDYKDELLRSNPGSTCVVKLGEANEFGRVVFEAFYICFAALKIVFMSARKCIGLDVAKDGNNQMLPLAWAVVENENTNSLSWFISLLQEDLGLRYGTSFTIMSNMQKGLDITIKELLPACEERRCARHILANWSKNWKGLQRMKLFWKCARNTFEAEFRENLEELSKLGRPRKLKRKEAGETKVSGKLSKIGLTMTCSLCHVKGHNKRSCHLRKSDGVGSIAGEHRATPTSNVEEPSSSRNGRGRGRPKKSINIESEPVAKKGRGRPKSASASASANASNVAPRTTAPPTTSRTLRHKASTSASRAASRTTAPPTTSRTPTHEASANVSGAGVSSRAWSGRGRGSGLGSAARGSTTQGVDQNTNVAPKETATARKRKGVGNTTQFKRPRVTGMGVFQAGNGFKTFNPGLPSSRILAGPKRVLRSNIVTGMLVSNQQVD
ncbi:hypothetical protein KY289_003441 [Solanum tuberosum]|nr:hypothetical protein KY289_003441 [Solanum tuberosum]